MASRPFGTLHHKFAALTAGLVLAAGLHAEPAAATADLTGASATPTISTGTFERRIKKFVNMRRVDTGRKPIRYVQPCLDGYAEDWATYLATTGLLQHRPDLTVVLVDCELTWAGEALARGSSLTPRKTVNAWMKSPSHRAVILKRRANRLGIGVQYDAEGRVVAVLNAGDVN